MIRSFRSREVEDLHRGYSGKRFRSIATAVRSRLARLDAATSLVDLARIPGNRLEPLKGGRKGQHSIRINDQWRICFVWRDGDAFDVEVVDHH